MIYATTPGGDNTIPSRLGISGPTYWTLQSRAHSVVLRALKSGELRRGECSLKSRGGCKGRIEGHHWDYGKPLEVMWVCQQHHMKLHAELRREGWLPAIPEVRA